MCISGKFLRSTAALVCCCAGLLTGCGGGGSSGGGSSSTDTVVAQCSALDQRQFVRQHIDDKYLFYRYAGTTLPSSHTGTGEVYFYDITRNTIPSMDRYSFVMSTSEASATFQEGVDTGLGLFGRYDANNHVRITRAEPNSPGGLAGMQRGDRLLAINGLPIVGSVTQAQNDAFFTSTAGAIVTLDYSRGSDPSVRHVSLTAASYTNTPLPLSKVMVANNQNVGYLAFHSHILPAELQLADTFQQFAQAGVNELVLDLRYNNGGYTAIASQVAYMVAGAATSQKVFEYVMNNDKHSDANYTEPFYNSIGLNTQRRGEFLPTLNLTRVYVLTSSQTCSASELIINGLRGIDIEVIAIGGTTCGKPYGMLQQNYCDSAYFALQFESTNAKGEGRYTSGLAPTCSASDDVEHALGDPAETMLSMALSHQSTGRCPQTTQLASVFANSQKTVGLAGNVLDNRRQSAIFGPRP
jgi:C-terminal processing protease CtpA/Prc